jgi:hypothetical protein
MPRDVARAALYRGIINLWVEDELTREYLSAVWTHPPDVFFLIAGGNEGVSAVVKDAEAAGFPNVFGPIDRDFRPTNRADWNAAGKTFRRFVLPVHEIENDLLDPEALASSRLHTLNRTAEQIDGYLMAAAGRLTWWAACRRVVAELKSRFRDRFVPEPPCGRIADESSAINHICTSEWFRNLAAEATQTTTEEIRRLLADMHQEAQSQLSDGCWRTEFAGKEIYRDVGSQICDRTATALRGYAPTPVEFDIDLAKDVAAGQVAANRVHHDLIDLLAALRSRISSMTPSP